MTIVGVTGSLGTGKTTVAGIFGRLGAVVLDADDIAHRLIEPGKPAWKKIVSYFGKDILKRDLHIDRQALGKKAFSGARRLKRLCAIIHPLVYKQMRAKIKRIKKVDPSAVVVLDVPLLLETGGQKYTDKVVVVTAPRSLQLKRGCGKFGLSRDDIMRRIKAQMPLKEKIKAADFVVDNGGTVVSTEKQVMTIWKKLAGT